MFKSFIKNSKNLYFSIIPFYCAGCKKKCVDYLCKNCLIYLNAVKLSSTCKVCANHLENLGYAELENNYFINTKVLCNACVEYNYVFNSTFELFEHDIKFKTLIYAVKHGNISLLKYLAGLLANNYKSFLSENNISMPDLIIPVPISNKKLYIRGYNQSLYIAEILSKILNIPYKNNLLSVNHSSHNILRTQHLLNRNQRSLGLEYIISDKNFDIKGLNILLADDVITTGTTLNNIAQLLIDNGASSVGNAVLARTQMNV